MNPGTYEICPVIDGIAAWPWGQIVIHPIIPSGYGYPRGLAAGCQPGLPAVSPELPERTGTTGEAWAPPSLGLAGTYFEEQS